MGVRYRKRATLLVHRHCPHWLVCCGCAKMTVNDLSTSDFTRDSASVPVSRESAATGLGRSVSVSAGSAGGGADGKKDPIDEIRTSFLEILGSRNSR